MSKTLRAIVFDTEEKTVRLVRANVGKTVAGGKIITIPKKQSGILGGKHVFIRERSFMGIPLPPLRYVVMREGSPVPLSFEPVGTVPPMDAGTFYAAIRTTLVTRLLNANAMDWKTLLLLIVGGIAILQGVALAGLS